MLPLAHRFAFALFAAITLVLAVRGFWRLRQRVLAGRRAVEPRFDHPWPRLWYALRTTLLQSRTFRRRPVLSTLHAFIFYAFVLYLVVNAVDALEGFVPLPALQIPWLHAPYALLTDVLSVLALVAVVAFVLRRFAPVPARRQLAFNARTLLSPAVRRGFIQRDSLLVSAFILFHIGSRLLGNAARLAAEGTDPWQPFGSALSHLFNPAHALGWRIFGYWGALGSVLLFLAYFPYSKHLHLLAAPVNYLFKRDAPTGVLPPFTLDLESAQTETAEIGAAHLADLTWPRLLDAYACVQCNRCQDVCPASATGKALSPAALEINKRMALNGIAAERSALALTGAPAFERGLDCGPALLEAVLSPEAVWACTTCGACMEVCPTQDEQMLDIIDMRRNLVMLQGEFPAQLQTAFRGMERNRNPWGLARDKRMAWAEGLHVPTVEDVPDPDVLYWVGCAASFDAGAQKTARAVVQLLTAARVRFAVLGKREGCTGDSARRAGNELLYAQLATETIATLQSARARTVLASCPHCVNTIGAEYPQFGGHFEVVHHTEYLAGLVSRGDLAPAPGNAKITFHDPCYLGRHRGSYAQPRDVLHSLSVNVVEMPRNRENAFCCGAGGAQFWKEEEPGDERVAANRLREAHTTLSGDDHQPGILAVGCPFCKSMLASTPSPDNNGLVVIKDVAELLWEGIERRHGSVPAITPASASPAVTPLPSPAATPHALVPASTEFTEHDAVPAPRGSGAPATLPGPEAVQAPALPPQVAPAPDSTAVPAAPARKKWAPKQATSAAEASTPSQPVDPPVTALAEITIAAVEPRKKWTPKAVATPHPAPAPGAAPAPEPPFPEPTTPATAEFPIPSAPAAEASSVAESGSTSAPTTARKKWQPGKPKA